MEQQATPLSGGAGLVLDWIIRAAVGNDEMTLNAIGIKQSEAAVLRSLSVLEKSELERHASAFVKAGVDMTVLQQLLVRARERREEERLQTEMIQHGASQTMMRRQFKMAPAEYRQIARKHGIAIHRGRHATALSKSQETGVYRAWQAFAHLPLNERYVAVAKSVGVTIAAIEALNQGVEL